MTNSDAEQTQAHIQDVNAIYFCGVVFIGYIPLLFFSCQPYASLTYLIFTFLCFYHCCVCNIS